MSEEAGGAWGQLVPELYYDLIARLPAGIVFWLLVIALLFSTHPSLTPSVSADTLQAIPFGSLLVLLLVVAYVTGMIIVPMSVVVRRIYGSFVWRRLYVMHPARVRVLFERLAPDNFETRVPLEKVQRAHFDALHQLLYERVKLDHALAKILLPKMSAEVRLCENVVVVTMLVLVGHPLVTGSFGEPSWVYGLLVVALLALIAGAYRYLILLQRLVAYADTLGLCRTTA